MMMPREIRTLMRHECAECGSVLLVWGRLDSVAFELRDLDARKRAAELFDFCDGSEDAWMCARCGAFGAFVDYEAA
jgi:hypothetical protein